jgi:hypothetical protein
VGLTVTPTKSIIPWYRPKYKDNKSRNFVHYEGTVRPYGRTMNEEQYCKSSKVLAKYNITAFYILCDLRSLFRYYIVPALAPYYFVIKADAHFVVSNAQNLVALDR